MKNFESLALNPAILSALQKKGYTTPTPIQEQAIPIILDGKDIFGSAETGSGKTAAFAIPILQILASKPKERGIKALILAPTRELASQIAASFKEYGRGLNLFHTVVYGGVKQSGQVKDIRRGVDILIATPGRLIDLVDQGIIKLNQVELLVLDEADRMLDMGFIKDIRRILSLLSPTKQSMLFSATIPKEVKQLSDQFLKSPIHIEVKTVNSAPKQIKQSVYMVPGDEKLGLLREFLKGEDFKHVLVFSRTKRRADKLTKSLQKDGFLASAIHGDKSQRERDKCLAGFRDRKIKILVATDVASRGIDVKDLEYVINYDIPGDAETYVHRIGRTGRAGAEGVAVTFCEPAERNLLKDIHRLVGNELEVFSRAN
jgi:ATP-dependent RNA helicase RhlE